MNRLPRCFALALSLAACDLDLPSGDEAADDDGGSEDGEDDDAPAEDDDGPAGDDAADESEDDAADESSEGTDDESSEGAADEGTRAPAELLGVWVIPGSTAASAIGFDETGAYARASRGEATIGSCTTVITLAVDGQFVVDGDVLALTPTSAVKTVDECGTVTEEYDLPAAEELGWSVGQDEWGESLTLTDATGYAAVYHRE